MTTKRTPLGLSLEEHKKMAEMLRKLGKHLRGEVPDRSKVGAAKAKIFGLLVTLTGELDEFFYLDSKPLPDGTRPRVYYGGEPADDMSFYSFLSSREDLEEIRQRVIGNKSAGKVVKCIDAMVSSMNLVGLS